MYTPPDMKLWHGRIDNEADSLRFHQLIHLVNLTHHQEQQTQDDNHPPDSLLSPKKVALLGFASDEGVRRNQGRLGTRLGPDAAKQKLAGLCSHFDPDNLSVYDMGNITCDSSIANTDSLAESQNDLSQTIRQLLEKHYFPIVIGGGHELALGHALGIYEYAHQQSPQAKLGIINVDAHFDLRPTVDGFGNSGTPFWQIAQHLGAENFHYFCLGVQASANTSAIYKTVKSLSVEYIEAQELHFHPGQQLEKIQQFIQSMDLIYFSICLDSFASCYAPGVSAPNSCGLIPQLVFPFISTIMSSPKLISFDIAELSPPYDINERTAQLAAWFIWQQLHHLLPHQMAKIPPL